MTKVESLTMAGDGPPAPRPSDLPPPLRVAVARRMLALNGCDSGVGGQVSLRHADRASFHITPFQYFEETRPSDVLRVDLDLATVEGEGRVSPAAAFHSAIYRMRDDVNAVIHTHSFWVTVLATTGQLVGGYNSDAATFFDRQAYYDESEDASLISEGGIASALGPDNLVVLLSHHGAVVVGGTLEEATVMALELEHCAKVHLAAVSAGGTELPASVLERFRGPKQRFHVPEMWEANVRRIRRLEPGLFP